MNDQISTLEMWSVAALGLLLFLIACFKPWISPFYNAQGGAQPAQQQWQPQPRQRSNTIACGSKPQYQLPQQPHQLQLQHHDQQQHQPNQRRQRQTEAWRNPWAFRDMRGHKAMVTGMAMSSNGEYLASSSEGAYSKSNCYAAGHNDHVAHDSQHEHQQHPEQSASDSAGQQTSRRQQRKQQRLNAHSKAFVPASATVMRSHSSAASMEAKSSNIVTAATAQLAAASRHLALSSPPLKEFNKLCWSIGKLADVLRTKYLLPATEQFQWGYPKYDESRCGVMVYTNQWKATGQLDLLLEQHVAKFVLQQTAGASSSASSSGSSPSNSSRSSSGPNTPKLAAGIKFDVNAQPFVPGRFHINTDDGLKRRLSCEDSGLGSISGGNTSHSASSSDTDSDCGGDPAKVCGRCKQPFGDADAATASGCRSHPGKPIRDRDHEMRYSCCNRMSGATGCELNRTHVWSGLHPGLNGPFAGFERTTEHGEICEHEILSLDAEMVYTCHGLELAKVSVCTADGRLVYEKLVRPEAPIIDYNTRYSGITKRMLLVKSVRTLQQVQEDLLEIVDARTILVGHAINNDLRCLRILHDVVVDTAVVYPHHRGAPYRVSLRALVKTHLQKDTHHSDDGHDSYEDARNTMAVLLCHVRRNHGQ